MCWNCWGEWVLEHLCRQGAKVGWFAVCGNRCQELELSNVVLGQQREMKNMVGDVVKARGVDFVEAASNWGSSGNEWPR